MRRRPAFTMIELLIVIAIIAILIALLLPAIQSSREAARRNQCANNLMQLGIGLGNYASTHSVFPPGVVNDKGPILNLPSGYHHSWIVQILPFIGQNNVYRGFDFRAGVYEPGNETAVGVHIATLICPSRMTRSGTSSYAGCHHDVDAPIAADNHGVLYLNSSVPYNDIPDGSTQTILLGEMRTDALTLGWASGTRSTLRNTGTPLNARDPVASLTVNPSSQPLKPGAEEFAEIEKLAEDGLWPVEHSGGFASWHSFSANFLFCNGSVRAVKDSIDRRIYQLLANRADGEPISDDSF
jgi:prepilin-type N-terminal cleavage/methylation domain-containing protein